MELKKSKMKNIKAKVELEPNFPRVECGTIRTWCCVAFIASPVSIQPYPLKSHDIQGNSWYDSLFMYIKTKPRSEAKDSMSFRIVVHQSLVKKIWLE